MIKRLKILFFVLLSGLGTLHAGASPVRSGSTTITQPDGKCVTVRFTGDEFYKITMTEDGAAVTLCADGYLRYVIYENGKRTVTEYAVGGENTPKEIVAAARNIPYAQLQENARSKRRAYYDAVSIYERRRADMTPRAGTAGRGMVKAAVILVEFPDLAFTEGDKDRFNSLLNSEGYSENGADGSAKDYFKAQFGELADFQFDVYGPYTAKNGYAYYGGNDDSGNDKAPAELVAEACEGLDAEVDFSQYDSDGDGVCDFVFMFFAGNDEAQNPALYPDNIWSHAYVVDYYNPELYLDGVRISRYACTSELMVAGNGSRFTAIGTFCHEFSHILGLSDAYDTSYNYDGMATADALWGSTSIMDSGSYNNNGNTPPNYNAFEREMLEIASPRELSTGEQSLAPVNVSNEFIRIESDTENEYFIVECRKKEGWDAYIPASGMLVYHIDKSENDAGTSYNYGRPVTASERWLYNEVNSYPLHQCADLIEASYPADKNNPADIFFPGPMAITHCSSETHEDYVCWSGERVGYQLYGIRMSEDNVVFQLLDADALDLPTITKHSITVAGCNVMLSWETDKTDEEAVAFVNLSYKDGDTVSEQEAAGNTVSYMDLTVDTEYTVTIWYDKNGIEGEKYAIDFTTFEQNSDFPYIFINRSALVMGNTIKLELINLESSDCKIDWYLGDYIITTPHKFVIAFEGNRELSAIITYPDGRKERVATTINVPEAEEENDKK